MEARRLSPLVAALIGLLSVGAALAAGHLVAGFLDSGASPYLAVGNSAIDLTPPAVKDFAVRTFGTYDKLALLLGMVPALLLFAAAAGLVSRRRASPGVMVIGALGAVGVVAVLARPDLGQLAIAAPLVSAVAGVLLFRWLHRLALRVVDEKEETERARQRAAKAAARANGRSNGGGSRAGTSQGGSGNGGSNGGGSRASNGGSGSGGSGGGPNGGGSGGGSAGRGPRSTGQKLAERHGVRNSQRFDSGAQPAMPARRDLLIASAATALGAAVAAGSGQALTKRVDVQASRRAVGDITPATPAPAIPTGADFVRDGTPTFLTNNAEFYRIDTALVVPRLRAEDWSLKVHGMVERELTIDYDDLRGRPLVERAITLCCVSNEVGGPYISTAKFVGVPLRDVLLEAGVKPGADQLVSRSVDGWTCGTPTSVVLEPDRGALLALAMNGEPLPAEHGFPVRMVVPGLYGFVSATKWVMDLELSTFDAFDPYWARRGWSKQAPIKTMSRIDRPAGFERVRAGKVVIAGVAWAQHTGVDKVEVRADGGPWVEASLATEVNVDTWRMWRADLDLQPGGHTVEVRATDRGGYTQTQDRADVVPDGATGWHSVFFNAT